MEKDEAFDLLIRLAAPAGQLPDGIARLDRIVREQIPEALRKAAPPDFPGSSRTLIMPGKGSGTLSSLTASEAKRLWLWAAFPQAAGLAS